MDCSTPGLSVPHHLLKFAQVHVHCKCVAIQPSHPLTPSSPSVLNLSQHQGLLQLSALCIILPKYCSFRFSISPSNEYSGLISFKIDWFDLLAVQWTQESSPAPQFMSVFKHFFFSLYRLPCNPCATPVSSTCVGPSACTSCSPCLSGPSGPCSSPRCGITRHLEEPENGKHL